MLRKNKSGAKSEGELAAALSERVGKERIVAEYAVSKRTASTQQDDYVGRMLWALSDKRGLAAKRFAEFDPCPSLDWLEPFAEQRFGHRDLVRFQVTPDVEEDAKLKFSFLGRPTPYRLAPRMQLVQSVVGGREWDTVMFQMARWLEALVLLTRIIGEQSTRWISGDLEACLTEIGGAKPALKQDAHFRRCPRRRGG